MEYWHRQLAGSALFPDIQWSKPENKSAAGKLLIIGGHSQALSAPAQAYMAAEAAGIGSPRVLLPDAVRKSVQGVLEHVEFAPSTPSGSFAQVALAEWLEQAQWSDCVLLAGDLGHNSETSILVETFLYKYRGQLTLVGDTLDLLMTSKDLVLNRPVTLVVPTFTQLQKLSIAKSSRAITSRMDLVPLIDAVHVLQQSSKVHLELFHAEQIIIASEDQVSTTPRMTANLAELAAGACVWWLQNPDKPFQALTTSTLTTV